jgi:DNA (cytosine-5)-methyltransferase 1
LADTTSGRHKQSEQFSNGCPSQSDKRQSDSSGNCESQRQLMADSCGERCGGKEWGGEAEEKGQSERHSSERSGDSSVGNAEHDGSYGAEVGRSIGSGEDEGRLLESQRSDTADSAGIRAETVGNPEHDGSHGAEIGRSSFEASNSGKEGEDFPQQSEGTGRSEIAGNLCFWEDSTVIYCRDGKYRPIPTEPALFPLADGIPNRVGILRGAGNAIVPQAAAEIIKAVM